MSTTAVQGSYTACPGIRSDLFLVNSVFVIRGGHLQTMKCKNDEKENYGSWTADFVIGQYLLELPELPNM